MVAAYGKVGGGSHTVDDNTVGSPEVTLTNAEHDRLMEVALKLAGIHGDVRLVSESRGIHAYMASPAALDQDGAKELNSRHLAVNLEKSLGIGKWRRAKGTYNRDKVGRCMKYGEAFSLSQLLSMPPLQQRGYKTDGFRVTGNPRASLLFDDGSGRLLPHHPGDLIPLTELPGDHPAVGYVTRRGYDPVALVEQFGASFCVREPKIPTGEGKHFWFRSLPGPAGFRATPQGRIVFKESLQGSCYIWQARWIEKEEDGIVFYLHPGGNSWEREEWVPVKERTPEGWKLLQGDGNGFESVKYLTAPGSRRTEHVIGSDAALRWHRKMGNRPGSTWCVLVEGPLDAARIGPPALAILGKIPSKGQLERLVTMFDRCYYVPDNGDKEKNPGDNQRNLEKVFRLGKSAFRSFEIVNPWPMLHDPGDWSAAQACEFVNALNRR